MFTISVRIDWKKLSFRRNSYSSITPPCMNDCPLHGKRFSCGGQSNKPPLNYKAFQSLGQHSSVFIFIHLSTCLARIEMSYGVLLWISITKGCLFCFPFTRLCIAYYVTFIVMWSFNTWWLEYVYVFTRHFLFNGSA